MKALLIAALVAQCPPLYTPRADELSGICGSAFCDLDDDLTPDERINPLQNPLYPYAYQHPEDEFFCDDTPERDPTRCGLTCARAATEEIADDDPALSLFTHEPTLADRKVALAIERINACDEGGSR